MKVDTFYLFVDYGYGVYKEFHGLSRVALERYKDWYREESLVMAMHYRKETKTWL